MSRGTRLVQLPRAVCCEQAVSLTLSVWPDGVSTSSTPTVATPGATATNCPTEKSAGWADSNLITDESVEFQVGRLFQLPSLHPAGVPMFPEPTRNLSPTLTTARAGTVDKSGWSFTHPWPWQQHPPGAT